jgi:hypothetical protein
MSVETRLNKVMPALTVRERAVLALRAQNAGQDTTEITGSMPPEQRHQYNRYMALAFVAGCQFGSLVHVIVSQIESLDFDMERQALVDRTATLLEEDQPEGAAAETVRPWRQVQNQRHRPALVTVPYFLRCLGEELRDNAFKELCVRWQELRAVELVTDEIAASFDGEDPLHPQIREKLDACKIRVAELQSRLARNRRLPEPGDDYLQRTRDLVDQGFAALGLTEE